MHCATVYPSVNSTIPRAQPFIQLTGIPILSTLFRVFCTDITDCKKGFCTKEKCTMSVVHCALFDNLFNCTNGNGDLRWICFFYNFICLDFSLVFVSSFTQFKSLAVKFFFFGAPLIPCRAILYFLFTVVLPNSLTVAGRSNKEEGPIS